MAYKPQILDTGSGGTGYPYVIANAEYGDGSDGAQTFDGTTTILGMVPSANVYTMTRDIYLSSSTINSGVTIETASFRLFCQGTLTNNGTIDNSGASGSGATAGAGVPFGTLFGSDGGGGNGATGVGINGLVGGICNLGGSGGNGGSGGSVGGPGGVVVPPSALYPYPRTPIIAIPFYTLDLMNDNEIINYASGGGGGGGGGDGVNSGGGGGASGGPILLIVLYFAGTGTISSNGGNGANGATGATKAGGGGGGGGGELIIISRSILSGAIPGQTLSVMGGTGGLGSGIGNNGSVGDSGNIFLISN